MSDRLQPRCDPPAPPEPREPPLFDWPAWVAPRGRVLPLTVNEARRLAAELRYWLIEQGFEDREES